MLSGFGILESDPGDNLLNAFLLEHTYQSVAGNANWLHPPYFYPAQDVRTYTDLLVGPSLLFIPLRALGLDLFSAVIGNMLLMTFLSFLSCYYAARRFFKLPHMPALVAGALFAIAYPRFSQLGHLQMQFSVLNPLIVGAAYSVLKEGSLSTQADVRRSIFTIALCVPLLFASSIYHGFFCGLFIFVMFGAAMLFPQSRRQLRELIVRDYRIILSGVAIFAVAMFPVYLVFADVLASSHRREWWEVSRYLLTPSSAVWLGRENIVWGWVPDFLNLAHEPIRWAEGRVGMGITVSAVVLLYAVASFGSSFSRHPSNSQFFLAAFLFSLLLPIAWAGDTSLWSFVYNWVPGAGGIRAVSRFYFFLSFPAAILFARALNSALQMPQFRRGSARFCATLVVAFALVEQLGVAMRFNTERAAGVIREASAIISQDCDEFLLTPRADNPFYLNDTISRERFSETAYLAANPDLAEQVNAGVWEHFQQRASEELRFTGQLLGPYTEKRFDEEAYLSLHQDVKQEWDGTGWEHYQQYGRFESRALNREHTNLMNRYHTYSALVSLATGIPTVGGYSGREPANWLLRDPLSGEIGERIIAWTTHNMRSRERVCNVRVNIKE